MPSLITFLISLLIVGSLIILIVEGSSWYECTDNCNTYKYITISSGVGLAIGIILAIMNYYNIFEKFQKKKVMSAENYTPVVSNFKSDIESV